MGCCLSGGTWVGPPGDADSSLHRRSRAFWLTEGCVRQDYRDELATPACKAQVHKLSERASQDIRFDEPLADACYEDRNKLCDGVQPVRQPA